jgi:hypothetical protein
MKKLTKMARGGAISPHDCGTMNKRHG